MSYPPTAASFGNWNFQANSDGGVLSNFPVPGSWEVTVKASFSSAISDFSFVDGTKAFIFVSPGGSSSLVLRAYDFPSKCRLDCTVPTCGDGVLDGGEVCDDGNNVSGDGCSADCTSLL